MIVRLLLISVLKYSKALCAFHKRIYKYKEYVFTFLFHNEVPPDNNASERASRSVKVKQKVSGQFITENGSQFYAIIYSVRDICIKNGQNLFAAFKTTAVLRHEYLPTCLFFYETSFC